MQSPVPILAAGDFFIVGICFLLFFLEFFQEYSLGKAGFLPLTLDFAILIVRTRFDRLGLLPLGNVQADGARRTVDPMERKKRNSRKRRA